MSKSDLKRHNPVLLDLNKPDFVNEEGTEWWGLDVGDPKDGIAVRIRAKDGFETFAIMDKKGVFYETGVLEDLMYKFDFLRLQREKP